MAKTTKKVAPSRKAAAKASPAKKGKKKKVELKVDPIGTHKHLNELMAQYTEEYNSLIDKENKAAGRRARKVLQEIKKYVAHHRKEIIELVNGFKNLKKKK